LTGDRVREIAEQVVRIRSENVRLLERLSESERRFRRISRGVLRVQEEERRRISRDLHDGIGQSLTALKIALELLQREASSLDADGLGSRVASARQLAEACLSEVRQLSHLLRPQMLDDLGLVPTLRWFVRTLQERTGLSVELTADELESRLDPDVETLVYRLIQESLNNVVKHAGVATARVEIHLSGETLRVWIEDRGCGFDAESVLGAAEDDRGFGVRAMRDRVQSFEGRLAIRSAPGQGTRIEAQIPIPASAEPA
jgi:two-component system, NarL family, sensor kinase